VELAVVADPRNIVDNFYWLEACGEKPNYEFMYMRPEVEAPHWKVSMIASKIVML
jgi:hypothetical protein